MNNSCSGPRYYPWLGRADGSEYDTPPPPSAEEKWKAMNVIFRTLRHDWKYRERRRRMYGCKRARRGRGGVKLGMRLLSLTER